MKHVHRCAKCRHYHMEAENDIKIEWDWLEQRISFNCPNCKYENVIDFANWKKKQQHSPLPNIGVHRG